MSWELWAGLTVLPVHPLALALAALAVHTATLTLTTLAVHTATLALVVLVLALSALVALAFAMTGSGSATTLHLRGEDRLILGLIHVRGRRTLGPAGFELRHE